MHLQLALGRVEKVYIDPHHTWVLATFQGAITTEELIVQSLADFGYPAASVRLFDGDSDT